MFTGIITEIGTIEAVDNLGGGIRLAVLAPQTTPELGVGNSVSVSGACQTVIETRGSLFIVETVEETIKKTTFGRFERGYRVNLELPARLGDRLGGHLVQGHVDGVGHIRSMTPLKTSTLIRIAVPAPLMRYVIPVGSIAIDGVSLTVASLDGEHVTVSIIPHTLEHTTLGKVREGTPVNVECDLVGKYIEGLSGGRPPTTLTEERLRQWGYDTTS